MRGDFRAFADQRDVHIDNPAATLGHAGCGVAQEAGGIGVFPLVLTRRKMATDIAIGHRAINRVAQRMNADIGIGMAVKAEIMRHVDAAEDEFAAFSEHMHVKASADTGFHHGGENPFEPQPVFGVGEFDVVVMPRHQRHCMPSRFQDRGVIGGTRIGIVMQLTQQGIAEALRGLRAVQFVARDGADDDAMRAAFEGVGNRGCWDGTAVLFQGGDQIGQRACGDHRAGSVMHQHDVGAEIGQSLQAVAHRILPRLAPGHWRAMWQTGECFVDGVCVAHWLNDHPIAQQGAGGVADDHFAGDDGVLLGDRRTETAAGACGNQQGGDDGRAGGDGLAHSAPNCLHRVPTSIAPDFAAPARSAYIACKPWAD